MQEAREYMLHVIWRTMDPIEKFTFLDDTEQYYIPRLKLEKDVDGKIELYDTTSDIYRPVERCFLEFAYENSIKELSDVLCYSYAVDKVERLLKKEKEVPEPVIQKAKDRVRVLEQKTNINLNQIKENYGKQQRSTEQTVQGL